VISVRAFADQYRLDGHERGFFLAGHVDDDPAV